MKVIKGLILFVFVVLGATSCFDPPNFPDKPEIDFEDIYFGISKTLGGTDSIMLSITFKDGDGDLGLDADQNSYPYHPSNFFLAKGGELIPVSTFSGSTNENPPRIFSNIIELQDGQSGKLATIKTRDEAGYDFMPPNIFPYSCTNYRKDTLFVLQQDASILDNTYNIVDTLTDITPNLFKVYETFYYEDNPNHYNITVQFEILNPSGSFTPYAWNCNPNFDGRFPTLSDKSTPLDGTLHYAMKSAGFRALFSTKTIRLKVQIKDRALHESNILYIHTGGFTLDQITRR